MYRIFCESYENFRKSFSGESIRLKNAEPIELIINVTKYKKEQEKESMLYKELCDLLDFMSKNVLKYPRLKAFLWTLEARNIKPKKYNVTEQTELEEQTKLINSFLKLAYWY